MSDNDHHVFRTIAQIDRRCLSTHVSVRGRITRAEDNVPTGAKRYAIVVTDASASIRITMWNSSHISKALSFGKCVEIRSAMVAPSNNYNDFHEFCMNFDVTSSSRPEYRITKEDPAFSLTGIPNCSRTLSNREMDLHAEGGTPPAEVQSSQVTPKRLREVVTCCDDQETPFCSSTGLPHPTRCSSCGKYLNMTPFCSATGKRHMEESLTPETVSPIVVADINCLPQPSASPPILTPSTPVGVKLQVKPKLTVPHIEDD